MSSRGEERDNIRGIREEREIERRHERKRETT